MSGSFTMTASPAAPEPDPPKRRRGFAASVQSRLTSDWITSNQSADAEIFSGICTLRSRCRDLERNNPYMDRFLDELGANIIGENGIRVTPRPKMKSGKPDKRAAKILAEDYAKFSERGNYTACGQFSRAEWSRIAVRRVATDGDLLKEFIRGFPHNEGQFAIQQFEADHLSEYDNNPDERITMGVRRDGWNRPIAYRLGQTKQIHDVWGYWGNSYSTKIDREIAAEHKHGIPKGSTATLLAVIHRFSQTRGYPWVASVVRQLRQLEMYEEAELVAARLGAAKLGFLYDVTAGEGAGDEDYMGSPTISGEPGSITRFAASKEEMGFESWDPNNPNGNYPEFRAGMLRGIAGGMKTSYPSISSDYEGISYSSARVESLGVRELWKMKQMWWIETDELPTYHAWLRWRTMMGVYPWTVSDLDRIGCVEMHGRRWQWVDLANEMNAAEKGIEMGITSRQQVCRDTGTTLDRVAEDQADDNEMTEQLNLTFAPNTSASAKVSEEPMPPKKGNKPPMEEEEEADE